MQINNFPFTIMVRLFPSDLIIHPFFYLDLIIRPFFCLDLIIHPFFYLDLIVSIFTLIKSWEHYEF
jgi:hypothetical protein